MMKHIILKVAFVFSLNIACLISYSQSVAINTDGSQPDPSAQLDVKSTSKGMLVPKMNKAQREAIVSPATGLLVYQTNLEIGFYFNAGTASAPNWKAISSDPGGVTSTKTSIALNQWFKTPTEFSLSNQPTAFAFDGRYIWLSYPREIPFGGGSSFIPIHKLDPTYGNVVGYTYANSYAGSPAYGDITGIVFDGSNLWFAHSGVDLGDEVAAATKMNPLNGNMVAAVDWGDGFHTKGIAFDGSAIWVAKNNGVSQIVGTTWTDVGVGHASTAIQFDGTYIWVLSNVGGVVTKITSSRTVIGSYNAGTSPRGIAFDGTYIWITNSDNRIRKLNPLTGGNEGIHSLSFSPNHIVFDGTYMWVTDFNSNSVARINSAGSVVSTVPTNGLPKGIIFDGNYIWVYTDSLKLLKIPL